MWFKKKNISDIHISLPREELLRRSRVLVIDDEKPDIIDDLQAARFAVDYAADITNSNFDLIDRSLYDLILLDFGGVGKDFGADEGLSLLRHIKRVNPAVVIIAYTSKALGVGHADFYRQADGTLAKDAGISESQERIEEGLRKAHSLENVWRGLLAVCDVQPGSKEDIEWQHLFVQGIGKERKRQQLKTSIAAVLTSPEAQKVGMVLFTKAVELGIRTTLG